MKKEDFMALKPFSLFKRNRIFYARFRLSSGLWSTAKSTGERTKGAAERWAIEYLQQGQIVTRENVTFEQLAQGFFAWSGTWATDKRARGLRLNERWCRELDRITACILIPAFGRSKLVDITAFKIKEFRNQQFTEGRSGSYINKLLIALKAVLASAEERGLIKHVPKIDKAGLSSAKEKGILTPEEVKRLFAAVWDDNRARVASMLACAAGLRLSEVQAITLADVHADQGYLEIRRSWDNKLQRLNASTKSGHVRYAVVPSLVMNEIALLVRDNPHRYDRGDDAFLFFGKQPDRPVDDAFITHRLYRALADVGIPEDLRRARRLSFHSHRSFFVSLLINSKISAEKTRRLAGHESPAMTQLYLRIGLDDMNDVREIQERIFSSGEGEKIIN